MSRLSNRGDLDAKQPWIVDFDLDPAVLPDDEPEHALRFHGVPDLAEAVVDPHASEMDEALGRHVQVTAHPTAGLTLAQTALETNGATHRHKVLARREQDVDALVRLDWHDPLLPQLPSGSVRRRLIEARLVHRRRPRPRTASRLTGWGQPTPQVPLGPLIHDGNDAPAGAGEQSAAIPSDHGFPVSVYPAKTRNTLRDNTDGCAAGRGYGPFTCGSRPAIRLTPRFTSVARNASQESRRRVAGRM